MKDYVIFGAGMFGQNALNEYGADNVLCFADNNEKKQGSLIFGKEVLSLSDAWKRYPEACFLLASQYIESMERDVKELGIIDYIIYRDRNRRFFETDELILNPYEHNPEMVSEDDWNNSDKQGYARKGVFDEVERLYRDTKLFDHIEIETINRCNGACDFCPVNHRIDPREKKVMTQELFYSIISQLEEMDYIGRFTTFSNNEPLLDDRIVEWNRYARKHLPHARMHLYTNGTIMTIPIFEVLVEVLDELIIDNYQKDLKLIKPCREIVEYVEKYPQLKKKVTIVLRNPHEILTSRGGDAPNRKDIKDYEDDRCLLPFKQMIVRPDGKVSLCCNDALGKYTLGDVNEERLVDIWYGKKFETVREALYKGRKHFGNCRNCDTFIMG